MLLSVVPPSKFEGKDIQKIVRATVEKRGFFRKKDLDYVIRENMVWMPYHRIRFNYMRSEGGLIQRYGETALNAMFCGCVKSEREFLMLFRPNYLKYEIVSHSPQSDEIVGPVFYADFDGVLGGFVKRLIEVKDELSEVRSELHKSRVRIRRYSWLIPATWDLKKERTLSEKVAKLAAAKNTLSMCLNVNEDVGSIEVAGSNIFYYPTLVVTFKNKETGTKRYLIVNLVESGLVDKRFGYDRALTELCDKNSECKEIIVGLITS